MSFLRVEVKLCSMIAGDPPHLDALLECELARHQGKAHECDRSRPAPPIGEIAIPMIRSVIAGHVVARCSSPIMSPVTHDGVEHFARRMATQYAEHLHPQERTIVRTGAGAYKSYRLPLRVRQTPSIVWFCEGDRQEILHVARRLRGIGKKREYGYGRVASWNVERVDEDYCWFAGDVVMRPLPLAAVSKHHRGWRQDFGACQSPYWHPERYQEIAVPC